MSDSPEVNAATCTHEFVDYQDAEPDVGLRSYALCEDCGADLTDAVIAALKEAEAEIRISRLEELRWPY